MELLIAILFIVILVLLIRQKNSYVKEFELLRKEIISLREQVSKLATGPIAEKPLPVQEKGNT